jgi:hypothetical protein
VSVGRAAWGNNPGGAADSLSCAGELGQQIAIFVFQKLASSPRVTKQG